MHDVFEIAFRVKIAPEEIVSFVAKYFCIDRSCVVSEDVYWSEKMEGRDRAGINIEYGDAGLMTNLSGISFAVIDDLELEKMAREAAKYFSTEVIIGDYRKNGLDARGCFLSYFPDGSSWEAVDASHDHISDVKVLHPI